MENIDEEKHRKYVRGRYRKKHTPYSWEREPGIARNLFYETVRQGKPESILDIGCGQGQDSTKLSSMGVRYVGVDPIPKNIEKARKRNPEGDFRLGYMQELPFPDESFDWSYSISVWEGLPKCDDMKVGIKEALRVTKHRFYNIDYGGKIRCFIERYMTIPPWYRVNIWRAVYHAVDNKAIVLWEIEKTRKPAETKPLSPRSVLPNSFLELEE